MDEMLRDLKADNITRKNAALLSDRVLSPIPKDRVELKRVMSGMSPELFADLLRIKLVSAGTIAYEKYCADEDICGLIDIYNDIAAAK